MEKLIITAAICGAEVTKASNPAVPYTVEEMVREAKSAYEAGAAILHIHVREDDGTPTQDRERFRVVMDAIRKELPDVIMIPSTGGATGIALAFNKVTGLSVSAILFVVNVVMLLLGKESIKEVIAFPKVQNASELMSGCPAEVEEKSLQELALRVELPQQ